MAVTLDSFSLRKRVHFFVLVTGLASLSWEVLWQIKSSLALGVSAWGTALTLAITMGGMSVGAFLMGNVLKDKTIEQPVRIYGVLEIMVGFAGLFLGTAFHVVEKLDTWAYQVIPGSATFIHILGIVAVLGIPTICMGATLPVFGLIARQFQTSIAILYGLNTLGAASGALIASFLLIPEFGLIHTGWIIAAINIAIGVSAWVLKADAYVPTVQEESHPRPEINLRAEQSIVLVTGFSTLLLEVAWFRSLIASFYSTTAAFAIMLASVLIALGGAAQLVPKLKREKVPLSSLIIWAGLSILLVTPIIERSDLLLFPPAAHAPEIPSIIVAHHWISDLAYIFMIFIWFLWTLCTIGPSVLLLGTAVPWILDDRHTPRRWGQLYAMNTLAAISGSIIGGWLLLPTIGFARTAWFAGSLVTVTGILTAPRQKRFIWTTFGIIALVIAVTFESGVGRTRVQVHTYEPSRKLLESYEGPEATVSAIEYSNGRKALVVDGLEAAVQLEQGDIYMAWMGHLPMLLNADPKNALVICFGTGQTANAVRKENPQSLDIVDINPRVFKLAHNFPANQGVLNDPRTQAITMDGRAYMRRIGKTYDVITLEPMPPAWAGVNALYSREFYEQARKKLNDGGVIAQWLPFHLVALHYGASIAKTFQNVFPNAILWIDPTSKTGILLGSKDDNGSLGTIWPGFMRTHITRKLSENDVRNAMLLNRKDLSRYGAYGEVITDDNQLLAYSMASNLFGDPKGENFNVLNRIK